MFLELNMIRDAEAMSNRIKASIALILLIVVMKVANVRTGFQLFVFTRLKKDKEGKMKRTMVLIVRKRSK